MKLVEHFDAFLTDTVNLNQDRIDTLEDRVETIEDFLYDSDYEAPIRSFSKQGSWAHKTIIRPLGDKKEFDADLVVYVDPVDGWTPRDYILKLRRVFLDTDRYRAMTRMRKRCVTLDYAGDFHLDIVPIVVTGAFRTTSRPTRCATALRMNSRRLTATGMRSGGAARMLWPRAS